MTEIDLRADTRLLNWSELGVSGRLPTGTVTLLSADVEGSARLWHDQPERMTAAVAQLDRTLADIVVAHNGVRPTEQGDGDSFVVAFAWACDAVACALALQRAPLALILLRIGIHTGDVQLRDEANYIGPTVNRAARLRDLAHGSQTLLSGTASDLVVDQLPANAWLTDLGTYPLRDLPRPERVVQLCHPDLHNEFPPLRLTKSVVSQHLPPQLTSFVGRDTEMADVCQLLAEFRLVTLTGAGGVGKTRLAIQVAAAAEFRDGVWFVDLAPITDPDVVPVVVARALGLPDQPGRSTIDTLLRFISGRQMLMVLDNCEHLLDASAALVMALAEASPGLKLLATSREPIGVTGEATWRVPSLALADEAIELFTDRARLAQTDFSLTDDNAGAVAEICRRLDGMPLAIELAAARVRALSPAEIVDSLHDCFRLLTGGARTAVRRQQTLRASVDWSHALLTETERILFRRLAVFLGGFDFDAAKVIGGSGDIERHQVLDLLSLLVDKSLVIAEDSPRGMRYRLLETVRQYALEKLAESGEADAVRSRHRDHYTAMATLLDSPAQEGHEHRLAQAEIEIDNLRAALAWSRENADIASALTLLSSLQPLWLTRDRSQEGVAWFDTVLTADDAHQLDIDAALRAKVLADRALLATIVGAPGGLDQAQQALEIAREIDDASLLARVLTTFGVSTALHAGLAGPYFAEAASLARELDDRWRLSQTLGWQALAAIVAGDPIAARTAAEEGLDVADTIGYRFTSRQCRWCLAMAQLFQGDLARAAAQLDMVAAEAEAVHDIFHSILSMGYKGFVLAFQGDASAARAAVGAALEVRAEFGELFAGTRYEVCALAALVAGDVEAAKEATAAAGQNLSIVPGLAGVHHAFSALPALAEGDLVEARRRADEAVTTTTGWYRISALSARARIAIAQGEPEQAEFHAHDAFARAAEIGAYLGISDTLECLAGLTVDSGSVYEAARLLGAADAIRQRTGAARLKIWQADYEASIAALRAAMNKDHFKAAWAEGAALSTEEAIAYARRGRGGRRRPSTGWASLTPAELDVVRLVSEGLANNDIATRLFISPRTVESHLTHVYTKLGFTSRVLLAQEVARHS